MSGSKRPKWRKIWMTTKVGKQWRKKKKKRKKKTAQSEVPVGKVASAVDTGTDYVVLRRRQLRLRAVTKKKRKRKIQKIKERCENLRRLIIVLASHAKSTTIFRFVVGIVKNFDENNEDFHVFWRMCFFLKKTNSPLWVSR